MSNRILISWIWEDAFDKFGFDDGEFHQLTEIVADDLRYRGFVVEAVTWGCHNRIIESISRDGIELIPADVRLGYDEPREYLPHELVSLLDRLYPRQFEREGQP